MGTYRNQIRSVFSTVFVVAILSVPNLANAGDDCSCRYKGQDIATGKTICMKTSQGFVMAKCDWVLNNTSWKFSNQPCPYSELNQTPLDTKYLKNQIKKLG